MTANLLSIFAAYNIEADDDNDSSTESVEVVDIESGNAVNKANASSTCWDSYYSCYKKFTKYNRKIFDLVTNYIEVHVENITQQPSTRPEWLSEYQTMRESEMVRSVSICSDSSTITKITRIHRVLGSYYLQLQNYRWEIFVNFVGMSVLLIFGMIAMLLIENFTAIDSFYWAVVSVTTIGYGNFVPETTGGKIFTMVFIGVGCLMMAQVLSNIVITPIAMRQLKNEINVISQFEHELTEQVNSL